MQIGNLQIKGKIDFVPLEDKSFSVGDWVTIGKSEKAGKVETVSITFLEVVFTHLNNRKEIVARHYLTKVNRRFKLFFYWKDELKFKI